MRVKDGCDKREVLLLLSLLFIIERESQNHKKLFLSSPPKNKNLFKVSLPKNKTLNSSIYLGFYGVV